MFDPKQCESGGVRCERHSIIGGEYGYCNELHAVTKKMTICPCVADQIPCPPIVSPSISRDSFVDKVLAGIMSYGDLKALGLEAVECASESDGYKGWCLKRTIMFDFKNFLTKMGVL